MSRIGKQPVTIPTGVKVQVQGQQVKVEGPKGKLEMTAHRNMQIAFDDKAKAINPNPPGIRTAEERAILFGQTAASVSAATR